MEDFNFNFIIVIVFLVIGAIRWVIENMSGKKRPPEAGQWEEYDYEEQEYSQSDNIGDLYEEARREILDRQNRNTPQPEIIEEKPSDYRTPTSAPPPLPVPGKARINRPTPPASPPAPEPKRVQRRPVTEQQAQAAAAFEQHSKKDKRAAAAGSTNSRVRKLLANPTAARDAIVLAEILGKPKGVR